MVAKNLKLAENKDTAAFESGAKLQFDPVGSSGTEIYAGYFSEEYLQVLRGKRGAKIWDEMRRSEPQIAMLLNAIMNPIKAANWTIEPAANVPNGDKHARLCEIALKQMIDWEAYLHEALTFLPFGYSLFEVVHSIVFNHPELGTFNGLKALAFRSQKTIENWKIERQTGKLLSVDQYVWSDVGHNATIPGDFLLVFSLSKEGDNYEGISALRPMYGPYFRKNLYQKLAAIGVEKYAIGTPIGKVPTGKEKSEEMEKFKQILAAYTSHEASYIVLPKGWEIEIQKTDFKASEIKELIILENTEMVNSVVANFLALGMNGGGGAFALGTDLSDFFLSGIQSYANLICGVKNRKLLPELVKMNFGPQSAYPTIKCTGIDDKAGKELAEIIKTLTDSKNIKPDMKLEEFLRKQYKLPVADVTTARDVAPAPAMQFSETSAQYNKRFNASKDDVKELMKEHLALMLEGMKKSIKSKWNAATPAARVKIAAEIEAPGIGAYKAALKEALAEIANAALDSARRDVPKAKNVKLAESIQLAAPRGGYFAALPANIKRIVETQASLITTTQAADVEKVVSFQFASSASSTESIDQILHDIEEAAGPVVDGAKKAISIDAAASNAVASIQNQARLEFFFEPEVLNEIESFTFTNEDPISEICQELNGTTFAVGDPDLDRYSPPLHHNCKSRLVPNLKSDKGNPEIDRGGLSISSKALKSMTLCECHYGIR